MKLDVSSLGNAIVDVQFSIEEDFVSTLEKMSIQKGSMTLIEAEEQSNLIDLLNKQYGNGQATGDQTVQSMGVDPERVPDHVTDALTKDYSQLMKAIDKKKTGGAL